MIIKYGLDHHAVLQRNKENVCDIEVVGYIKSKGSIRITWNHQSKEIPEEQLVFNETENPDYTFEFHMHLIGIPTGGPYTISLNSNKNTIHFEDILVGDVYVLAGQSNMEGIGKMSAALEVMKDTRALYMDDTWRIAKDPLHQLESAIDPVHKEINGGDFLARNPAIGVGPGVSFSQTLYTLQQVPIGLLCCAHGGTSMEQWKPSADFTSGNSLYSAMMRRIKKAGLNISGLFWHQGCNETYLEAAENYQETMTHFISQFRKDVKNENLPIVMAQISRVGSHDFQSKYWNQIQNKQFELVHLVKNIAVLPTIHFEMDDFIHLSGRSQNIFGEQAAQAMLHLITKNSAYSKPIEIEDILVKTYDDSWNCMVEITFKNLFGALQSLGLPNGFVLSKEKWKSTGNYIYKTELSDNKVILHTTECALDINNMYLNYGLGFQPYCNITDENYRSLPVFINRPLGKIRHLSEPATKAWIMNDTQHKYIDFGYYNLDLKNILARQNIKKLNILMPFTLKTTGTLNLLIGGIGEIEIFIDNQFIEALSLVSEKILPDSYSLPCDVEKGNHLLQIKYTSNIVQNNSLTIRFENMSSSEVPIWTL